MQRPRTDRRSIVSQLGGEQVLGLHWLLRQPACVEVDLPVGAGQLTRVLEDVLNLGGDGVQLEVALGLRRIHAEAPGRRTGAATHSAHGGHELEELPPVLLSDRGGEDDGDFPGDAPPPPAPAAAPARTAPGPDPCARRPSWAAAGLRRPRGPATRPHSGRAGRTRTCDSLFPRFGAMAFALKCAFGR